MELQYANISDESKGHLLEDIHKLYNSDNGGIDSDNQNEGLEKLCIDDEENEDYTDEENEGKCTTSKVHCLFCCAMFVLTSTL